MNDFYVNLGRLIKERRIERNLTTQELADILGISIGFLSNVENAKTDTFNVELMLKLQSTLDISLYNFLPTSNNELFISDLSLSENLNKAPDNIADIFSKSIDVLINAYLSTIKKHNYDSLFINKITTKLLQELSYTDGFKL